MQYRTAFVAFTISQTVVTFLDCVAVLAIFSQIDTLGGWSRGEVLFLYSASVLSFGLADFTFGSVEYAAATVIDGSFDGFLVRPAGVMTQLLGSFFALRRFGRLIQCLLVLVYVFGTGAISIASPTRALFAVAMVIGFFIPGAREFSNAFTYGGNAAAGYPSHIFGSWLRNFVMWVLPAAFVSYVPAIYVLDAPNPLHLGRWLQLISPLACIPLGAVAALVWRSGVRHYESTGS
jgi:ABC-2 type transport system permease protein